MKVVIFACVLALAVAAPDYNDPKEAKILRDDRVHPDERGAYSFDFETDNGIKVSQGGETVNSAGTIEYTLPDGNLFTLKFVANENGYQPESPYLPLPPVFPHPIPDFVLKQIAFAKKQKEEEAYKERN